MTVPSTPSADSRPVRRERHGNAAILVIDNPPVNATSREVRAALLQHLEELAGDADCRAVIITGAGRTFVAGADIREFGRLIAAPTAPEVIAAIEAAPQPVLAAINGAALGGGLELAMGCDYRLARKGAELGLPEITLGFIPGNGSTQRLPRLAGLAAAIDLVTSGRRMDAEAALAFGIVDDVVEGDVVAAALARARAGGLTKRPVRGREVPPEPEAAIAAAEGKARERQRRMPWIADALAVLQLARTAPFDEALAEERRVFERLRMAEPAFALRHLFFAERAAAKPASADATPRPLHRVAVVGGGFMGSGIAFVFLDAGFPVTLIERGQAALEAALARVEGLIDRAAARGASDPDRLRGALRGSVSLADAAAADLVLEAVVEDQDIKRDVFAALGSLARPGAVLASNTSYLDLAALARASGRPADCCGLHFFSPAAVAKLLEVVRTAETADDVVATGMALARRLGKVPVLARAAPGFIGNTLFADYRTMLELTVEEGAAPQQVDAALEAFGFAMGPFRVFDLAGLDIAWRARQRAGPPGPGIRRSLVADRLCERGRFGQKTGAGWYRYAEGSRMPLPDPEVAALIEAAAVEAGTRRRRFSPETIVHRAMAALLNRAALLVAQGIARQAGDIDVVMANGYGFPRAKGGPLFWASRQDPAMIRKALAELRPVMGEGMPLGEVMPLLEAMR